MPQCPICKSEAEEIDLGLFDGTGFSCKRHGEFRVADSVFKESRVRTYGPKLALLALADGSAPMWNGVNSPMYCLSVRRKGHPASGFEFSRMKFRPSARSLSSVGVKTKRPGSG
jgi:hypothetical protein